MFLQVVDGRGKWEYLVTFFGGGGGGFWRVSRFVFAFCFGLGELREWVVGGMDGWGNGWLREWVVGERVDG